MSSLKGSHISPSLVVDGIGKREAVNAEARRKQQQAIEEQLDKWEDFLRTPHGQACRNLAEPKIAHLDYQLGLPMAEIIRLYAVPLDCIEAIRAEWRGERKVWYQVMVEFDRLREEADKLKNSEKES